MSKSVLPVSVKAGPGPGAVRPTVTAANLKVSISGRDRGAGRCPALPPEGSYTASLSVTALCPLARCLWGTGAGGQAVWAQSRSNCHVSAPLEATNCLSRSESGLRLEFLGSISLGTPPWHTSHFHLARGVGTAAHLSSPQGESFREAGRGIWCLAHLPMPASQVSDRPEHPRSERHTRVSVPSSGEPLARLPEGLVRGYRGEHRSAQGRLRSTASPLGC